VVKGLEKHLDGILEDLNEGKPKSVALRWDELEDRTKQQWSSIMAKAQKKLKFKLKKADFEKDTHFSMGELVTTIGVVSITKWSSSSGWNMGNCWNEGDAKKLKKGLDDYLVSDYTKIGIKPDRYYFREEDAKRLGFGKVKW